MVCNYEFQCTECKCNILAKVTLGYGKHYQFLLPCPDCKIELGFSVNLFPENGTAEIADLINLQVTDQKFDVINHPHIFKLDVAHLIPQNCIPFMSPFMMSYMVNPNGVEIHQIRATWSSNYFPIYQKLMTYYETDNVTLFNQTIKKLSDKKILSKKEMFSFALLFWVNSIRCFMPEDQDRRIFLAQKRDSIISQKPIICNDIYSYYSKGNRISLLWDQLNNLRYEWGKSIADILLPFNCISDTGNQALLTDTYVCQKRFRELKSFYVDCFEILCRISVIFASFIMIEKNNRCEFVSGKKKYLLKDFDILTNGEKISFFKHIPEIWQLIICLDNKKRNGIGHHSAQYKVLTDSIAVRNQSPKGHITDFTISYNEFCYDVLQLYIAIENLSVFVHWLYKKERGYV